MMKGRRANQARMSEVRERQRLLLEKSIISDSVTEKEMALGEIVTQRSEAEFQNTESSRTP